MAKGKVTGTWKGAAFINFNKFSAHASLSKSKTSCFLPRILKCELLTKSFSGFDSPFGLPAIACKHLDANKHHFLSRSKTYWMSDFISDNHNSICKSLMPYVRAVGVLRLLC